MKTTITFFKACLFFMICLLSGVKSEAQTMNKGDIAFIGYNTGGQDGFAFIALNDLPAGQTLYFTEQGWSGTQWMNTLSEPHLAYVIPAGITCGKIISFVETAPDIITVTGGGSITFALGTGFNLSGGDQIIAYQSASGVAPATPIFISAIHGDYNSSKYDPVTTWNPDTGSNNTLWATSDSAVPTGLENGVNCISLYPAPGPEFANAKYNGTLTGTSIALRAAINNPANWMHDNSTSTAIPIQPSNFPTPSVTCINCTAPAVPTLTAATTPLCNGASRTITITGNLNSATAWHVYSGSCGGTLVTSTSTGSFSVSPTTTTTYYVRGEGGCVTPGTCATITVNVNPALVLTTGGGVTNTSCNGGSNGTATVAPTGGTPPYTYSWAPSGGSAATATGLSAGAYTVTVTDNVGCTATRNFSVFQPSALGGTASKTDVSCNGGNNGTASVAPTGGTPPYTYSWAPSGGVAATATGLAQGTYTVTVTDNNGCQMTRTVTVNQPANALSAATGGNKTDVSCNGGNNGTATVAPTGGTTPYSYSWAPSGGTNATAIGLGVGTYTVTVTDFNGCQATRTYTINQPAAALGGIITKTDVSCNGGNNGTATISASGGTTPYSYSWSPSGGTNATATGLGTGTYTVTITDFNGCQITRTTTVNQPAAALGGTISKTDINCNGGANGTATVSITGGTTPYSYSWAPSGGTNATATGLATGTYTVTVTDFNGCQITRTTTVNQPATAISAATGGGKTDVSCNGGSNGTATVAPTGGTPPYTYSWAPSGGTAATATGLAAGTYTVTVTDNNSCQATRTFTINQPATALGGTISKTDVSCNGGSNGTATVSATGGTPSYTYSWAPSGGTAATATGLAAGTYTVTVTDANACQITRTVTVNQPASALSAATGGGKTDVSCNGGANGTATVAPTGGTTPYSYSWAPVGGTNATATGLTAGTYTVTVTDFNGCQATRTYTINQPTALGGTASKTDVSCNGGSNGTASVSVTGGTPSYTYSWAPSGGSAATATGLAAGTYTVTVTDANACQITRTVTVNQPASALSAATGGGKTDVSCNGGTNGTATVAPTGGTTPYSYSWAPSGGTAASATGLAAGTYTVTVTDFNGCQTTRSFTINQPTVLSAATGGGKTDVSCNGGTNGTATVAPTGGTPPYTYSWAPSGGTAASATGLAIGTYTVTVTDNNNCQTTRSFTITQPTALSAATGGGKTDVSCNGGANGAATVAPTGGTPPYTYSWSPSGGTAASATGLAAGTYTVTVTDANTCQTTRSFTINQPTALTATTSQTDVSCNGGANGTASVVVSGGTPSYTYSWAPSGGTAATASGLTAGTYTVTITDANACQITRSFTIAEPTALTATTSQTNVSCNGGSNGTASVTASGGTPAYTYSWAPSGGTAATATGLAAGTYTVTITDANACQITRTVSVSEPNALSATTSQTDILCNGGSTGSASVTVSGGTGAYTYSWAPSGGTAATASGLAAGTYTVTVTDANLCQLTRSFTIAEPTALSATTSQTDIICNGSSTGSASVTVSGGTGAYTYSWAPSGGTAATATGLAAGTYTVTVTDANLCQLTRSFTIAEPAALSATPSQTSVSCNGGANGSASVVVTGGTGAYTYSWAPSGGTAATATGLAAGNYTVTITDANLCQITRTIQVTQPSPIVIVPSQSNVSCTGGSNGSATVGVTGGAGNYTFSWAPSGGTGATATGLVAGTYTVTVTDANSCQATHSFTITTTVDTTPPVVITTNITVPLTAGAATITAAQVNNGSTDNCGIASLSVSPSTFNCTNVGANTVTLTVTDNNGNIATGTATVTITDPSNFCGLSVPEFGDLKTRLYPNPTNGMVTVEFSRDITAEKIEVYSITGQLILSDTNKTTHSSRQFNMERFPSGVYLVKITTAQGTQVKRLMRE
ncbi:T9SS type A sorting domain-containing protein [Flavobacterium microcysteis]|uniref:T9SS type A sorting domain-containing protein n=1 Tax=Flavobacterium microcysteis TaxID=2596891 RepID=A0A501QCW8_9FLAO|nr:T9SS type A sorting domain-containing protein [Flavobacterium microcysteis]TPD69941.1 T9SS type A sorting domain-containing protein [Flavobacterium microcysteis]